MVFTRGKLCFVSRAEIIARSQPATRAVAIIGVPPPPVIPNQNPVIAVEAGIFTSMVAEFAAACQEKLLGILRANHSTIYIWLSG